MSALRWLAAWLLPVALACGPTAASPKRLGEPCQPQADATVKSTECADGICIALDTSSGFCTRSCAESDTCPEGYACSAAGRYGKVCKKSTGCKVDQECPAGHVCNVVSGNCYINVSRTLCSPCQDEKQCPEGGACFTAAGTGEQFCTAPCAEGKCPQGFECSSIPAGPDGAMKEQCVPAAMTCNFGKPLCAPCTGDGECGGFFDVCVRNVVSGESFCGKDCAQGDPNSCPIGFTCVDLGQQKDGTAKGPFQCVPNSNTCKSYCDAVEELAEIRQCGLGKDCDTATHMCAPAVDGRQCAPCQTHDDCRLGGAHPENRCIQNDCPDCPFKGEAFCASPCSDSAACERSFGYGFVCEAVTADGATRKYCMPQRGTCQSGLGRLGDDCSQRGAQDCVAGVCLKAGLQSFCSLPCSKDSECQDTRYRCCEVGDAGYDCADARRTLDGPLSGSGVCAPLGGLFGDDCAPGRPPCQTGTCLDLGTSRVCTLTCANGTPCPDGFGCRKAVSIDGSSEVDVCFPTGGGQTGAQCAFGPAACESGLCIRKESGSVCSQACGAPTDCPPDWECAQVVTVDKVQLKACLPAGLND